MTDVPATAAFLDAESLGERARRVIGVTARAWAVVQPSPRALARSAPHGHVPARVLRRLRKAAASAMAAAARQGPPAIAHSW